MEMPANKTKIVCTIGPASDSPEMLAAMIEAGMNVARLNFSHGDFSGHQGVIAKIRAAEKTTGKRVAIMADLPGPKMRIGMLAEEPIELKSGDPFCLTVDEIIGDHRRVSVSFSRLSQVVKPGNHLYLNDGIINLRAERIEGHDVHCTVVTGGELRSKKGLNLPGINLGISAFTDHDRACLEFALKNGVDSVSQSFVENAADVEAVRQAAADMGYQPFIIAKLEREGARNHLDAILAAADGIMIARGDLGVEIPIEQIPIAQKRLVELARKAAKPVIVATQMLESMTESTRPTRAEATDVANAILDGTDCVMLSGESAMGKFPLEAVRMLKSIATAIEPHREHYRLDELLAKVGQLSHPRVVDLIARNVYNTLQKAEAAMVFVPTHSGATARNITRFRLQKWIVAVCAQEKTCRDLQFSSGVYPVFETAPPDNWREYTGNWLKAHGVPGNLVLLTEGPSKRHPEANHRIEIIELKG